MPAEPAPPAGKAHGGPPVDLILEGETLVLIISLPSVRPNDFRVSLISDRQVHVEGTVFYRHPVPPEQLVLADRTYGPFARTISLPYAVDPRRAEVDFRQGVLTVRLPLGRQRVPLAWQAGDAER